jgi:quinol monooxygenase YgiN
MSQIYWLLAVKIHPGQLDAFKAISARLVESTRNEPETLNYEWTLSEDGTVCHIYERYKKSDAIALHIEHNGALVGELFQLLTPISFVIYGSPEANVRAMLADLKPVYMTPLDGFSR